MVGRVDGASSTPLTLAAATASTCTAGALPGGGTPAGGPVSVTTDPAGYFSAAVTGVTPGDFLTVRVTAPSTTGLLPVPRQLRRQRLLAEGARAHRHGRDRARLRRLAREGALVQVRRHSRPAHPGRALRPPGRLRPGRVQGHRPGVRSPARPCRRRRSDQAERGVRAVGLLALRSSRPPSSRPRCSARTPTARRCSPRRSSRPSVFSPSVFSPSVFSPSVFSPSVFSPSVFSPSVFSPSVFSPSVFSPSVFSPSVFSPDEIARAFSSAQTRSIIGVSATQGTGDESVVVNSWNNTGSFYVRVGQQGRRVRHEQPVHGHRVEGRDDLRRRDRHDAHAHARRLPGTGLATVILTDSSRLALGTTVPGGGTLGSKLAAVRRQARDRRRRRRRRERPARHGPRSSRPASNAACPFAKNLVAEEIKGIVDSYRADESRAAVRRARRRRRRHPVLPLPGPEPARPGVGLRPAGQQRLAVRRQPAERLRPQPGRLRSRDARSRCARAPSRCPGSPSAGSSRRRPRSPACSTPTRRQGGVVAPELVARDRLRLPRRRCRRPSRAELEAGTGAGSDLLVTPADKSPAGSVRPGLPPSSRRSCSAAATT